MPFIQQGAFSFLHANQPDNLSAILTADQIKNKFDSQALELKTSLNNLIIALGSTVLGDSGAKNIGTGAISGVTGATVQDMLINLKSQIDTNNIMATGGTINGAVTVTGILQSNNSIRADSNITGTTTLVLKNSVDDAYLRFFTTGTNSYLASSNYGSTASRNLLITGYSGNNMANLTLKADTTIANIITTTGITSTGAITINGTSISNSGNAIIVSANTAGVYLRPNGSGSTTGEFSVSTAGTASVNGNLIVSGTISEGGTLLSSKYLPLATGGTIQGAVIVNSTFGANSNISEGGVRLDAKYAQLGANTFTASQTISSGGLTVSEGTISAGSATNDGRIRTAQTATLNYIQSGNNAGSAPKNLTISGYGATTMNECNIVCNTLKIAGQPLQSGMVTIVPVANTPTKVTVTFPTAYSSPPHVVVTAESGVIGSQVMGASVANITATQCDIYIYRNNTNSTNVHWIAMA